MTILKSLLSQRCAAMLLVFSLFAVPLRAAGVVFDMPDTIECRDVTPADFAAGHPTLKVIEARFRISAHITEGNLSEIVNFLYTMTSDDKTMRLHDYLPNTTLESAVAEDQIEVTNANENSKATGAEAHVAYKPVLLGASHNQTSKKSEASHYKQIAAKDLVLAAGTTNREHGVFFRLRPSRSAFARRRQEFTFLATVPKSWRGDLCTIACAARHHQDVAVLHLGRAGRGQCVAEVGMWLAGDHEAAEAAEQLCRAQELEADVRAKHPPKDGFDAFASQATVLFTSKKSEQQVRKELTEAARGVQRAQDDLKALAR